MRPSWLRPQSDPCNLHPRFLPLECNQSVQIVATTWHHVLPPLAFAEAIQIFDQQILCLITPSKALDLLIFYGSKVSHTFLVLWFSLLRDDLDPLTSSQKRLWLLDWILIKFWSQSQRFNSTRDIQVTNPCFVDKQDKVVDKQRTLKELLFTSDNSPP